MTAFYNEIDPYAAAWLRNLIDAGLIAPGVVDTRSIEDIKPDELEGFTQVHFFAGIGIWSYALRSAGWPDDRPVWTGSCPCQPFSAAGKGSGFTDERHLWPALFHLIGKCRPGVVFGEQVASNDGLEWWDVVQNDLENAGYESAALDLCAAGFGAPHIRQRLYWVANAHGIQYQNRDKGCGKDYFPHGKGAAAESTGLRGVIGMDNASGIGFDAGRNGDHSGHDGKQPAANGTNERMAYASNAGSQGRLSGRANPEREDFNGYAGRSGADRRVGYAYGSECEAWELITGGAGTPPDQLTQSSLYSGLDHPHGGKFGTERSGNGETPPGAGSNGEIIAIAGEPGGNELALLPQFTDSLNGFWASPDWLYCKDGKFRPVESGTFPLANGASSRVGRLRAYGNALVAPVAEGFVRAYLEAANDEQF